MKVICAIVLAVLVGCRSETPSPPAEHKHTPVSAPEAGHAWHGAQSGVSMLIVRAEPENPAAGQPVTLHMKIQAAEGAVVEAFEVIHEKQIHLIAVREGLDDFAHLHPQLDAAGNFSIRHTFPQGGMYRLYADHKPVGQPQGVAQGSLKVAGENEPAVALHANVPGRVEGDGLEADVTIENPAPGEKMIAFQLFADGQAAADLEPYLGAMGHLVVISADGQEYVHAHPTGDADSAPDGRVSFEAHFTAAGLYKAWGQFQRQGSIHTIPFVIQIDESP